MKKKKIILVLTGGLGNQLFQLSFVEYLQRAHQKNVYLDTSLGRPRSKNLAPDSFDFTLPCSLLTKGYSTLASKSIGYMMRMGYAPKPVEKIPIVKKLITFTASVVLSFRYKQLLIAATPNNLGYDSNFLPKYGQVITMGYFQSYKYLENSTINHSFPRSPQSPQITKYRDLARIEKPLIVHVRRGDYGSEDNFGLLGPNYYAEAIRKIETKLPGRKIWLFSDEPEKALLLFSNEQKNRIRVIEEIDNSPSHTLEVMRFGSSYVIANSTFSWWAAKSAYETSAPVVAPAKWFKNLSSPLDIIPEKWLLITPDFL